MNTLNRKEIMNKEKEIKILRAYMVYKSCNEVGKKLGVSRNTVSALLKKHGINFYKQEKRGKRVSSFFVWAKQQEELPRDMKELSKLSGIKYNTIVQYLRRREQRIISTVNNYVNVCEANLEKLSLDIPIEQTIKFKELVERIKKNKPKIYADKYSGHITLIMFDGTLLNYCDITYFLKSFKNDLQIIIQKHLPFMWT